MAKTHVKQHYVASSYLDAWCDPQTPEGHEPYVWAFPSNGGDPKRKPPVKLFHEKEMYTRSIVIGGVRERDLHIEHGLCALEGSFARLRKDFIEPRAAIPRVPLIKLLAFVAAQKVRTPTMRSHLQSQWGAVLEKMDDLDAAMKRLPLDERRRISQMQGLQSSDDSITHEQVRSLATEPLQETVFPAIQAITPRLLAMKMALVCTDDEVGFITSDEPCVWFDPEGHKRPPMLRGPALMDRTVEITMPLTPSCMLFLSWDGPSGFTDAPMDAVDEFNRRTRAYAENSFVSRSSDAKPVWFDRGSVVVS